MYRIRSKHVALAVWFLLITLVSTVTTPEVTSGADDQKQIKKLIKRLKHRNVEKRLEAIEALVRYEKPEVVNALAAALSDKKERVREKAASALWQLSDIAGPAESALRAALDDPSPAVKIQATGALRAQGVDNEELLDTYRAVLAAGKTNHRFLAARGLIGYEPGTTLLPAIIEYGRLQTKSSHWRSQKHNLGLVEKAITKLANTQERDLIPLFIAALKEPEPLSEYALTALAGFQPKPDDWIRILLGCLPNPGLQCKAADLLGQRTARREEVDQWVPDVTALVTNSGCKRNALTSLGKAGGLAHTAMPRVLETLEKDKESEVRIDAVETVGAIADHKQAIPMNLKKELAASAKPVLVRVLKNDSDPGVRESVIVNLPRLQLDPTEVVTIIANTLANESNERVIIKTLLVLRHFEADAVSAIPTIERFLNHPNSNVQRTAKAALESAKVNRKWKRQAQIETDEVAAADPQAEKRALETLRSLGVKFDERSFERAIGNFQLNVIEAFLDAGMSPNHRFSTLNQTPLHTLFRSGCKREVRPTIEKVKTIARFLLDRGAEPNLLSGGRGNTPLSYALWDCDPSVSLILLEAGADPKTIDGNGETVMMTAMNMTASLGGDGYKVLVKKGFRLSAKEAKTLRERYKDNSEALKVIAVVSPK